MCLFLCFTLFVPLFCPCFCPLHALFVFRGGNPKLSFPLCVLLLRCFLSLFAFVCLFHLPFSVPFICLVCVIVDVVCFLLALCCHSVFLFCPFLLFCVCFVLLHVFLCAVCPFLVFFVLLRWLAFSMYPSVPLFLSLLFPALFLSCLCAVVFLFLVCPLLSFCAPFSVPFSCFVCVFCPCTCFLVSCLPLSCFFALLCWLAFSMHPSLSRFLSLLFPALFLSCLCVVDVA